MLVVISGDNDNSAGRGARRVRMMQAKRTAIGCLLGLVACTHHPAIAQSNTLPRLTGSGSGFTTADGKPVLLRGCNLGNWLMIEPWMLAWFDVPDQATVQRTLARRFGAERADELLDLYRKGYVQARDFEQIRTFGFNVVRLPIDYRLIEDDAAPGKIKPNGFRWIDRAIELAEAAGMYVILDLHGAPGGQSKEGHTGEAARNDLWASETNLQRTADLWRVLAERYRGRSVIAAYDLLNEPFGDYRQDLRPDLQKLCRRMYDAVRSVDPDTIIFFPGTLSNGISFYGMPAEQGYKNVGFTEHFYPGLYGAKQALVSHARLLNQKLPQRAAWLRQANAPYLVGEFNIVLRSNGGDPLMRAYYDAYAEHGWASTMWAYKILKPEGGATPDSWGMVTNAEPMPKLDIETASYEEVRQWFESIGTMPLAVNETLRTALVDPAPAKLTLDPLPALPTQSPQDALPAGWTGADVGHARGGGQAVTKDGAITVFGSGSDIFGAADSFRFVSRECRGKETIAVEISALLDSDEYAKAGVMIRAGEARDAAFVMANVFPNGVVSVCWRPTSGAVAQEVKFYPDYDERTTPLRLARTGDRVTAEMRLVDGQWKVLKSVSAALGASARAGYAVTSHDSEVITSATFRPIVGQ